MAKFYTFIAAAFMASAISVAAQDYTVTISPDPAETYETLPTEFVLEFDGPTAVTKNISNQKTLLITAPDGVSRQVLSGTYSGTTVSFTIPENPNIDLDKNGEYTVQLNAGSANLTWPDGSRTKCEAKEWKYTVENGNGGGGDEDNAVKYDIEITGVQPGLNPFDAKMKTLETLQMSVNCGDVRPVEGAMVHIVGPGYNSFGTLLFNMGTPGGKSTSLKTSFAAEPEYNGSYTLTIPAKSMGNPAWFEDPETGRTNDLIEIDFEVTGAKDPSEMTVNTGLGIIYSPALNTKVPSIDNITMTFTEDVLFDENVTVNASKMSDFAATAYQAYGTASFERIDSKTVKVIFERSVKGKGSYRLNIPEGTFYTEEFLTDKLAGKCNAAQNPIWVNMPQKTVTVEVESTVPAANAAISHFPVGYQVIVNTDNNEAVASMSFTLVQNELDNDAAAPKTLLDETTTEKNDEGAICWTSTEEVIFAKKYFYELSYTLKDADDVTLVDGMIEFDGDDYVGINELIEQATEKAIFSIQGIRINNNSDKLPAGLYIINGKKILVK